MGNIEQLKNEVKEIRDSLNELKEDVSLPESEKKKQAEKLKSQAEVAKHKVENEIKALENSTDSESEKKIEEAKAVLNSLTDVMNLYNSIIHPSNSPVSIPAISPVEEKSIFAKAKYWIGEQWNSVRDGEKRTRSSEGGKNVLRAAGFAVTGIGAVAIAYKGLKKLRKRAFSDDEEETEGKPKKKKKKEKKPFWDRWYGKVIKYSVIGTGIYYIIHGINTGKYDISNLFDWNHDGPTSTAEEVLDNYTDLFHKNPEKYKEYEHIGENINLMYDKIRDTEKNYFGADSQIVLGELGDRAKEQKIKKAENFENIEVKGMVPYSMDNYFSNIGDMLSYGGVNGYIRSKNIEEYKQKLKGFTADWFDKTMVPFLSSFANFATFGIVSTDSAQQKMDKYLKGIGENASENLEILDLFFRQYTKVLTYIADKKNALALKYAKEILPIKGYGNEKWPADTEEQNEMLYEAINDSEWVEQNLKNTKYGAFLQSNIVGACRILKEEGLDDVEMTDELKDIVEGVDAQTAKLIGGFDNNVFTRAEYKLSNGESLDTNDKNGLQKISKNIIEDLGDTTNGGRFYNTFDYGFELLGLSEADKQTILKESGLSKCLEDTATAIDNLSSEVYNNPTKENVNQLKELIGEYTSMKKEIAVALYAINEAKENKDMGDYITQVLGAITTGFGHFIGSANNILHGRINAGDIINTFVGMTISGGILEFGGRLTGKRFAVTVGHYTKKVGLLPCTLIDMGLGHTRRSWAVKKRINDLAKTNPTKAENLMKKKILDGILTKKHVSSILQSNETMKAAFNITGFQNNDRVFKEVVYNIFGDARKTEADLFIKYYRKVKGLVSYTRESIGNGGLTDGKFRMQIDADGFKALKDFDVEFDKLGNTVQKSYFEQMLKKVKNTDDIKILNEFIVNDNFKNAITNSNFDKLKKLKISQLKVIEESGLLDDLLSNTKNIDQVMNELKAIEKIPVSEIRNTFRMNIDEAIKKLGQVTANPRAVKYHIKQLKRLKYDVQIVDDEMEMFSKFISKGFDARIIPDIKKILDITDTLSTGEKIGEKLRNLLSDGNFSEVKGLLLTGDRKLIRKFDNLGINDSIRKGIVNNFDNVIHTLGHSHITSQGAKNAVKTFFMTLHKIL